MSLPVITLKKALHRDVEVLQLHFAKNDLLMQRLRSIKLLRWSKTMQCWYLPFSKTVLHDLFVLLKNISIIDHSDLKKNKEEEKPGLVSTIESKVLINTSGLTVLSEEAEKKIAEFRSWLKSKRYSDNTIGTYVDALKTFLRFFSVKSVSEIDNNDIIVFNNEYILKNKLSSSFQNQVVNAVKLFFSKIENKKMEPELIHRPKRPKVLPNVLSKEDVKELLSKTTNLKHKAMLSLIYACGLRCGELLKLKLEDIDSKRHLLIIRQAKGRKDRVVPLSPKTINLLIEYYKSFRPKIYLFEGQNGETMYDDRSLQQVLKTNLAKTTIKKPVTLHWLRHSYATHLLENGTDLRYIQELLGHSSSRTTEIYTHVSMKSIQNITSPFDYL